MGLRREQVYIANILKARPPQNRTPLPNEVDACGPFLAEQIRIIRPKVIVALGGPAAKWLLKTDTGITRLRGQWATYTEGDLEIPPLGTAAATAALGGTPALVGLPKVARPEPALTSSASAWPW